MTDRQITHAPGCWGWGPKHYECAVREIELMAAEWKRVTAAQGEAEARAERLAAALRELAEAEAPKWGAVVVELESEDCFRNGGLDERETREQIPEAGDLAGANGDRQAA